MEQTFHVLSSDDRDRLAQQRGVVEQLLGADPADLERYATATGKLAILTELLDAAVFDRTQTYELQCLGIVLGDVFVQACGWEWSIVEDEYGRDPCIKVPGSTSVIFPLTMISKRVENDEAVDVFALFEEISADTELLAQVTKVT